MTIAALATVWAVGLMPAGAQTDRCAALRSALAGTTDARARAILQAQLVANGCTTTTTTSSTSSTSTPSTTSVSTTTTLPSTTGALCSALQAAFARTTDPAARQILVAQFPPGCQVPGSSTTTSTSTSSTSTPTSSTTTSTSTSTTSTSTTSTSTTIPSGQSAQCNALQAALASTTDPSARTILLAELAAANCPGAGGTA